MKGCSYPMDILDGSVYGGSEDSLHGKDGISKFDWIESVVNVLDNFVKLFWDQVL